MLWFTVPWLLCLREVCCWPSLGKFWLPSTPSQGHYHCPPPPIVCGGLRVAFLHPCFGAKVHFLNQLECLGNGPIAPVGGPIAPPMPLHIPITCPYRKKPPHLILCCTISCERMRNWCAEMGNSTYFLRLWIWVPFPLPLLPNVAISVCDGWAMVPSQILAAGRQCTLLNDSSKN